MTGAGIPAQFVLGIAAGLITGIMHLFFLQGALQRAFELERDHAKRGIIRGIPLRLMLWVPAIVLSAQSGLVACLGLVAGMVASRGIWWLRMIRVR